MNQQRLLLHAAFLGALPIVIAWFGLSVATATALVLLALIWRWMISLATFIVPQKTPELVLDSVAASHFVEKVRWNMDRAAIDYTERTSGGTLGAFFSGRTVPRLWVRTGAVRSQIGNSAEILRYLWGAYSAGDSARTAHLEPTVERLELETRCDRYGVNLQVWVYHHILPYRDLTLYLWGVESPSVPRWQRLVLRGLYPLLGFLVTRSFRITPANFERSRAHIDDFLADIDATLEDGRASILGEDGLNFTDFAFAAMTGLWLQPQGYSGSKVRFDVPERTRLPQTMCADVERWSEKYPHATQWVERLYAQER